MLARAGGVRSFYAAGPIMSVEECGVGVGAEIGPAPHLYFPGHDKLACWVSLCPGSNISASKCGRIGGCGQPHRHPGRGLILRDRRRRLFPGSPPAARPRLRPGLVAVVTRPGKAAVVSFMGCHSAGNTAAQTAWTDSGL